MKKYTKKELIEIFLEIKKYTLAGLILQNVNLDDFRVQKLKETQNIWDLDIILGILTKLEQSMLEANVSSMTRKFLKSYKNLCPTDKKQFKNSEEVLQLRCKNMQKSLK